MKTSPISKAFDDADELIIERDDEGVLSIKGLALLNNVHYKISVHRNQSGSYAANDNSTALMHKPLYTGTISILDPAGTRVMLSEAKRRQKDASGKEYTNKDIYATIKFQCNSIDETTLSRILMRQVNTLFLENVGQLDMAITKAMRPEQVTPLFAADKYLGDFMTGLMANASPESIVKQQEKVKKALSLLPCVPIARLSKREVNTILESNKVSNKTRNICSAFFEFLITNKKCTGKNPIKIAPTEDSSEFNQNKSAFTTQELSEDVFKKLFEILNKKETCLNCVIALLISGFSKSDVNNLIWGNIEFTKEKDLVIVHINRDYSGISKHDFSRPAIINTARYLKRVYQSLRAADEEIDGKPIFPYEDRSKTNLSNEVNNILVRAGFAGKLALPGRPGDGEESIPLMILQNNYRRMLISKAGLKDDPDTLAFLSGQLLKSSTFVNYESHTSPDAQKRLFTILKPLAVEEKISKKSGVSEAHGQTVFFGVPATTHEVVRIIGTVNLPPGKTLTIRVPHGGTGVLDSDFCRKG